MIQFLTRSVAYTPTSDERSYKTDSSSQGSEKRSRLYSSFDSNDVLGAQLGLCGPSPFSTWASPISKRQTLDPSFLSPDRVGPSFDYSYTSPQLAVVSRPSTSRHDLSMSSILQTSALVDGLVLHQLSDNITVQLPQIEMGFGKCVVPARVDVGNRVMAAVAIVTGERPQAISENEDRFGVLGRFQLDDGRYVQLLRRGVTHREVRDWLKTRSESLSLKIAYFLQKTIEAVQVLRDLHQDGVAHMDIKASNMVTYVDGGGLIDIEKAPTLGAVGGFAYDSFYASPSQFHSASAASDVFSLGRSVRFMIKSLDKQAEDRPVLGPLFTWIARTQIAERDGRPSLEASVLLLRQLVDQLSTPEALAQLHTGFVDAHDAVFNPAHSDFFKAMNQNLSWDD